MPANTLALPASSGLICCVVSPVGRATIGRGAAAAICCASTFMVSRVFWVEKLNESTMFAGLSPTPPAICRCAPVSRQIPFKVALVIDAQLGSAAWIAA